MDIYLNPKQAAELIPGMTVPHLAQLRYTGDGPPFYKPSAKVVVYERDELMGWVRSKRKIRTDRPDVLVGE